MNALMKLTFGSCSDIGMVRQENQDSFGKFPEDNLDLSREQLFIVADGMGGHEGGLEASSIAVETMRQEFFRDPESGSSVERLKRAIQRANADIIKFGAEHTRYSTMGTTCSSLVLTDNQGYIGHVGDSRIYKITSSSIQQLTRDHTRVAELVKRGIISKAEAKYHPERSLLYRALGVQPTVEVDTMDDMPLADGECFLLCSDGLVNHVEDEEIKEIVSANEPQTACNKLVNLANERGGTDNVTVLIVKVSQRT